MSEAVATLHAVVEGRAEAAALAEWIAEDAVFHSPVMHTPQHGKALVMQYLGAALQMFRQYDFRYVRQVLNDSDAVLEFAVEMDGIYVNGADFLALDTDGKITDFKVMIRPLKGLEKVRAKMLEQLAAADRV